MNIQAIDAAFDATERQINERLESAGAANVSLARLRGFGRTRGDNQVHGTVPGAYYIDRHGWVNHGPGFDLAQGERLVERKGWRIIEDENGPAPRTLTDEERRSPFHALLRWGGVRFFPSEQIIALGWQKTPPRYLICGRTLDPYQHARHGPACYRKAEFPQLEGVPVFDDRCGICSHVFSALSRSEAELMAKKHMQVSHHDHLVNKELVTGLRDALAPVVSANGSNSVLSAEQIAQIAATAAIAAMQQFLPRQESAPVVRPAVKGRGRPPKAVR